MLRADVKAHALRLYVSLKIVNECLSSSYQSANICYAKLVPLKSLIRAICIHQKPNEFRQNTHTNLRLTTNSYST